MYGNCKHQIQDSGYLWEGEGMLGRHLYVLFPKLFCKYR